MFSLPLAKRFRREQYNYNFAGAKLSKVFFFTVLSRERRNVEKQFAQQDRILGFETVTKNELNTGKEMSSVKLRKIVFFIYCTYCNVMIYDLSNHFEFCPTGVWDTDLAGKWNTGYEAVKKKIKIDLKPT